MVISRPWVLMGSRSSLLEGSEDTLTSRLFHRGFRRHLEEWSRAWSRSHQHHAGRIDICYG